MYHSVHPNKNENDEVQTNKTTTQSRLQHLHQNPTRRSLQQAIQQDSRRLHKYLGVFPPKSINLNLLASSFEPVGEEEEEHRDLFISTSSSEYLHLLYLTMTASSSSRVRWTGFMPEDLLFQILLRLPVESLLRFKAVSKSWLSLIESPEFVYQHADRPYSGDTPEEKLIFLNERPRGYFVSIVDLQQSNQFHFKLNTEDLYAASELIGCFNGVVCLYHHLWFTGWVKDGIGVEDTTVEDEDDLFITVVSLWNPVTKHVKILPPPPTDVRLITSRSNYESYYGFGFDCKTKDFRVVKLIVDIQADNAVKTNVEIYSLNMDCWRVINAAVPLKTKLHSYVRNPLRKNEVCYWWGPDDILAEPFILSFNFSKEEFGIISMKTVLGIVPRPVISRYNQILATLGEKLACIHWGPDPSGSENRHCEIWVLDTCGEKDSWTNLCTVGFEPQIHPVGFTAMGKMVLWKEKNYSERELLLFDLASQNLSEIPLKGPFDDVAVYKESLVPVKGANGETYSVGSKWKENSSTWNLTVSQMILASIKEFAEILDHDASSLIIFDGPKPVPHLASPARWSPPPDGTIKLNTDGIWRSSTTKLGTFGWVARNAAGIAIKAACSNPSPMLSDLTAEAEAIRSALYGAREAGWNRIIVEPSYKPLVSMIEGTSALDSRVSCIVAEIRDICNHFQSISFSVLPMVLNTAAHMLAHHGFTLDEPRTWDDMPDWLDNVLAGDFV